jgi:hypothetical protein
MSKSVRPEALAELGSLPQRGAGRLGFLRILHPFTLWPSGPATDDLAEGGASTEACHASRVVVPPGRTVGSTHGGSASVRTGKTDGTEPVPPAGTIDLAHGGSPSVATVKG